MAEKLCELKKKGSSGGTALKESFSSYSLSGTGSILQFVDCTTPKIYSYIGPTTVPQISTISSNFFNITRDSTKITLTATAPCKVKIYKYSGSGVQIPTVTEQSLVIGDTINAFSVQVQTHIDVY